MNKWGFDKILDQKFVDYVCSKYNLKFLTYDELSSQVYLFEQEDQNIWQIYRTQDFASTGVRCIIQFITEKNENQYAIFNQYEKFGMNNKPIEIVNLFCELMIKNGFAHSSLINLNSRPFRISRKAKGTAHYIEPYNYSRVIYTDAVKEKNEKKLALSSNIEIKPIFCYENDEIVYTASIKCPFTFKNKIKYLIKNLDDIESVKKDFEIFFYSTLTMILRKKIVSKKLMTKQEASLLELEELKSYLPLLGVLNYN